MAISNTTGITFIPGDAKLEERGMGGMTIYIVITV